MQGLTNKANKVVKDIACLYGLSCIQQNLAWYLCEGLLDNKGAAQVQQDINRCIRDLVPDIPVLLNAFEIPNGLIKTPIAENWIEFNERDNQGEVQ